MARLIQYPATCHYCKKRFEKGQAWLQRNFKTREWECHCFECYEKNKKEKKQ